MTSQPTRPVALAATVPDLPAQHGGPDQPDPRNISVEAFARTCARLAELAEGWTPEADREYAGELAALLPHYAPGVGRERFREYAIAVQRLADFDALDEATLRGDFGADFMAERACRSDDVDAARFRLVLWHPYSPGFSGQVAADPVFMAEQIQELRRQLTEAQTDLARERRVKDQALTHNKDLTAIVDALRDQPAPYVPVLGVITGGLDAI